MRLTEAEKEFHRQVAAACFNKAWAYLDLKHRNSSEEEEMLHLSHASRYHWGLVGAPRNQAVGDWQLARVYAAIGAPELSLQFALSCLNTCEKKHVDGLMPSALEGVARAYAAAGDAQNARRLLEMAKKRLARTGLSRGDAKVYASQIRSTEALIRRLQPKRQLRQSRSNSLPS